MRALLLDRPGPPSSLRVGEAARPVPAAGEVRVRVDAVGLNPVDYRGHAEWAYPPSLAWTSPARCTTPVRSRTRACPWAPGSRGTRTCADKAAWLSEYVTASTAVQAVVLPEAESWGRTGTAACKSRRMGDPVVRGGF
jgi:NADPH:quinone reductase-like Zn-dependent oxidoreductase